MLSRCCFHHLVENLILYKKDVQHFYIGPILFQKIKSYGRWSVEKLTVKFYLVPGMRNQKLYLVPNDRHEKIYLAVKWLTIVSLSMCICPYASSCSLDHKINLFEINVIFYLVGNKKAIQERIRWCCSSWPWPAFSRSKIRIEIIWID